MCDYKIPRPGAEYPGLFITLEGVDGAGKTTQAMLLIAWLESMGYSCVSLREPGGTDISEKIRALLLDNSNVGMSADCELLLYEASRAQLVRQVIEPALKAGKVVICDRFFDSTFAYQAAARGLDVDLVLECNRIGSCGFTPDITLVLDIDPKAGFARVRAQGEMDRLELEGVAFQEKVRAGYFDLKEREPERICIIDATGVPEEVSSRLKDCVSPLI